MVSPRGRTAAHASHAAPSRLSSHWSGQLARGKSVIDSRWTGGGREGDEAGRVACGRCWRAFDRSERSLVVDAGGDDVLVVEA